MKKRQKEEESYGKRRERKDKGEDIMVRGGKQCSFYFSFPKKSKSRKNLLGKDGRGKDKGEDIVCF